MLRKVKFNVPAQIKNALGKRETLKPGVHDLDDAVINHWFIQGLIACGQVVVLEQVVKPIPVKPVVVQNTAGPTQAQGDGLVPARTVDLGAGGKVEVEELKPPTSKKRVDVASSIAAPQGASVVKPVMRRRKKG